MGALSDKNVVDINMSLSEFMGSDYYSSDEKWELAGGELRLMSPARPGHSSMSARIIHVFLSALEKNQLRCQVFDSDLGVKLESVESWFQPDVSVVCDESKVQGEWCEGPPDLVVEVLSPSSGRYDLGLKRDLYRVGGVQELWAVDVEKKIVMVDSFAVKEAAIYGIEDMIESKVFECFKFECRYFFGV